MISASPSASKSFASRSIVTELSSTAVSASSFAIGGVFEEETLTVTVTVAAPSPPC